MLLLRIHQQVINTRLLADPGFLRRVLTYKNDKHLRKCSSTIKMLNVAENRECINKKNAKVCSSVHTKRYKLKQDHLIFILVQQF